ncbi:HNH endonuclease [Zunongwangia sp.]|uniref:HNH endonuclease n=1 Tax=Zunongwangia sp. TaxID=1965325 RepID=UPI003AA8AD96
MTKRKSLSKKVRFEVFKRDKFQCQYCGKKAPDVVLNVDHIDPVANGGTNEVINLITSCFDCNQGKKARLLSDDTVIQKQRKQLELIQERREQLELMLEWKKTLTEFEDEKVTMVSDYWASMMNPYSLNENGLKSLEKLIKKFPIEDILEAIDIANEKYLVFDEEGNITKESVEEAFDKVGGICALKNMPELKKKMAYIKGICRNRFSYWDNKKGSIILNNYVNALKEADWSDERIIQDLENEVIPKSIESKNWSQWRGLIEQWTDDIINWSNNTTSEQEEEIKEFPYETLEMHTHMFFSEIRDVISALKFIGQAFPEFDNKKFQMSIYKDLETILSMEGMEQTEFSKFIYSCDSIKFFKIPDDIENEEFGMLTKLSYFAEEQVENVLNELNLERTGYSEKDKKVLRLLIKEKINNIA